MFNLQEYKERANRLSDLLPWAALVDPGVILNKDGSFMKSYAFRGADLDSSTDEELMIIAAKLNNALKRYGSGWSFFVEAQRRPSYDYPSSDFHYKAGEIMDESRRKLFSGGKSYYESDYYFTFCYLPPQEKYMKAQSRLVEGSALSEGGGYEKYLEYFKLNAARFPDIVGGTIPMLRELDDDELLTYLHGTISTKRHPVKAPEVPMYLDSVLCDMPLRGGLEPMLGDNYVKSISVMSFPGYSQPSLLDDLNHLPIEYRWSTRFIPLDKQTAVKELTAFKRKWFAKRKGIVTMLKEMATSSESIMQDSDAVSKSMDANDALDEVSDDLVSFGYYTSTVIVWDKDANAAEEKVKEVERVINSRGFVTQHEKTNALQAWLGTLPGHCYANVRRPLVSSLNLCHLLPASAVWAGPERNKHLQGPPLFQAVTSGETPFRFTNHYGDVGHTIVLGPTGAGKSVLLAFIAMQFCRYGDVQVYMFDKGRSALVPTKVMGGDHYDIAGEHSDLAFQPLGGIDDKTECSWASEWLISLFEQEKIEVDPGIKAEIWNALTSLATAPREQRTLTGFAALLQNRDLREAISPYTLSGAFGKLLDSDHDTLGYGKWQCFEMEELMNLPSVVPPVLSYVFHKLEQRFTGLPTLLILDEAWLFLDNPMFAAKIKEWLKVLRKANVSVIFATQSVADAAKSSIAPTLIESCPTRIFLPNVSANNEETKEFYVKFGLNKRQIQILAESTPKKHYYFQSPDGNRLFELGLDKVGIALCASTSKKDQALCYDLAEESENEEEFLEKFLAAKLYDADSDTQENEAEEKQEAA